MILNKLEADLLGKKTNFDPNNKEHLQKFKNFLHNRKWGDCCPFFIEWPYNSIPDMIKDKIIKNMFEVEDDFTNSKVA
jgi:hypothetical protein